jgi:hypothetical protein
MIGVNSLEDFQLKLDTNHEFMIAILDWSFPDVSHWVPRLNIARAYDIAKTAWVEIVYILSWETLDKIDQELWSERKPEGIYKKWTQDIEFKVAIRQKIDELNNP